MAKLVLDDLQCGGLKIYQDRDGYNFTTDSVLLANYFKARAGKTVAELCAGSGVISILGTKKTRASQYYAFELQKTLADNFAKSVEYNAIKNITIYNAPIADAPKILAGKRIDVVVANPPYFAVDDNTLVCPNEEIATATHEKATCLAEIASVTGKILKDGGKFYLVHVADRFAEICAELIKNNLQPKEVTFVRPTANKPYSLVLLTATKNGKVGLKYDELTINNPDGSVTEKIAKMYKNTIN